MSFSTLLSSFDSLQIVLCFWLNLAIPLNTGPKLNIHDIQKTSYYVRSIYVLWHGGYLDMPDHTQPKSIFLSCMFIYLEQFKMINWLILKIKTRHTKTWSYKTFRCAVQLDAFATFQELKAWNFQRAIPCLVYHL